MAAYAVYLFGYMSRVGARTTACEITRWMSMRSRLPRPLHYGKIGAA